MGRKIKLTEGELLHYINNIIKEHSEPLHRVKKYSRAPEDRARRIADKDIKSHYYEPGDPMGDYSSSSEDFRKHSLPYDIDFGIDDEYYPEEEINELGNRGKNLSSLIYRDYEKMGDSFTKRKPDEGYEFAEKWHNKKEVAQDLMDKFGIPYSMAIDIMDYFMETHP